MGEARRRKQAGYVPEPKQTIVTQTRRISNKSKAVVGLTSLMGLLATSSFYPKIPKE